MRKNKLIIIILLFTKATTDSDEERETRINIMTGGICLPRERSRGRSCSLQIFVPMNLCKYYLSKYLNGQYSLQMSPFSESVSALPSFFFFFKDMSHVRNIFWVAGDFITIYRPKEQADKERQFVAHRKYRPVWGLISQNLRTYCYNTLYITITKIKNNVY